MNGDHIDMGDGKKRAYSHLMILIAHWLSNNSCNKWIFLLKIIAHAKVSSSRQLFIQAEHDCMQLFDKTPTLIS